MADLEGQRTHVLLRAASYLIDNRILPHGYSPTHPDAALASPVQGEVSQPDATITRRVLGVAQWLLGRRP